MLEQSLMKKELIDLLVSDLFKITIDDAKKLEALSQLKDQFNSAKKDIQDRFEDKVIKN